MERVAQQGDEGPSRSAVLRIATFGVDPNDAQVHVELRRVSKGWGWCRWVGRRVEGTDRAEIAVVSAWDDQAEMSRAVEARRQQVTERFRAYSDTVHVEVHPWRVYGAWNREMPPAVLRILRGRVVEGDARAFDDEARRQYRSVFEDSPECNAVAAGLDEDGIVVSASLWTSWDAIARATGGYLALVLPYTRPGWAVEGSAVHYELVIADSR
jgi:hypothetical protein